MSTTIDQKVVEMRFDNKQFERATKESMSTLDKLKKSLNLTGASKGLDEINNAAKNNSLHTLGNAAEAVSAKFSALQIMGVTALANITNSAVNAGKRLIAAFTVDPVKTGFQEYELKMGSIQTIMASTGESLETVNKYLNELNTYSDKTIYSFSDMTNNIGKFTNAGVKLEDAVLAIKGISNEAAVSGANANEASRAMYNFSQALSAGYVKLIDWKSIENANMATVEFKQQLIETAVACGTLTKTSDGLYNTGKRNISATQNFNDSLTDQWMTTEVLTRTLANYATDVREMTDAEREAYREKLKGQGYTEEQIKNIEELGKKAFDSAQDVKTFSMMMDTLKEAAQSGWAQTWELIFGDFEQGKNLWTSLSKFFGDIIDKSSKLRNELLESTLGKSFTGLIDKVKNVVDPIKKSADSIKEIGDAIKDYGKIVDEIIFGKWGNGKERFNALTEAGYDWAHAQNLVNEKLGSSVRRATDYSEAQKKVSESQEETVNSTGKLTDAEKNRLIALASLDEEGLKNKNLTKEQIEALNELRETADKLGIPMDEFIKNLDEIDGRWILLNSFKNIGQSLVTVFNSLGQAWRDIFPPVTSDQLFNIIAGFHKLTTYLKISDETADKITRTFKGLFAILDIVLTLTAGPLKIAFKALTSILGAFDLDILDVTATIGDAAVKFRDWLKSIVNFDKIFNKMLPYIIAVKEAIGSWIDKNIDLASCIDNIEERLSKLTGGIKNWIDGLKNTDDVSKYIIDSLSKGFKEIINFVREKLKELGLKMFEGIVEFSLLDWASVPSDIIAGFNKGFVWGILSVIKNVRTFCTKIITTVKDLFQIHSPSKVMYDIGVNIVQGLINGITAMVKGAVDAIKKIFTSIKDATNKEDSNSIFGTIIEGVKNFGSKVAKVFSQIDFGKIFAAALGVGMLVIAKKAIDVLSMFGKPLEGLGDLLSGLGETFEGFGKNLKANAMLKKAKALLIVSAAIAILVSALLPLADLEWTQLAKIGASLIGITGAIALLSFALGRIGTVDLKFSANMIMIAGSLGIMAFVIKYIVKIAEECGNVDNTIKILISMIGGIAAMMFAFGIFVNADKASNMDKAGVMIFKMAAALLTMASVVKIVSGFTYSDISKGLYFITGVGILFAAIVAVSKLAGEHANKAGAMMWKMAAAIMIMAIVVKIVSKFSKEDIAKGLGFVAGVEALFAGVIALSYFAGEHANKAGTMLLRMSIAILIMVATIKMVSGMSVSDIKKGLAVVAAIEVLFAAIISVSYFAGKYAAKAGLMLIEMSIALGILVAITYIVSKLNPSEIWRALPFVAALEALFAGLIFVTKYAQICEDLRKTLIILIVAISLMVAAVVGLSFIDPKSLATATAALSSVMGMFAAMIFATKFAKNTKDMRKSLIALLGVVAVLAGIIALMSKLNPEGVLSASKSLSLLLLSFSSSIFILGHAGRVSKTAVDALKPMIKIAAGLGVILALFSVLNKFGMEPSIQTSISLGILLNAFASSIVILSKAGSVSKSAIAALTPMMKVAAELGVILALFSVLNKFGMEPSIQTAISLGILLNAFASSIVILSAAGVVSKSALAALQPMVLVTAELALILGLMSALNVEASIPSAIALGILVNALVASLVILQFVGPTAMAAIPAAICMGLVIAELAVAMGIMAAMNVQEAIPYAISLSILLAALSGVTLVLGLMAPLIPAAISAVIGLGVVIAELAVLLAAIGGIAQIPGLEWLISEGGTFLQTIGTAIGQFVGGIVGGIAQGVSDALPAIGYNLSLFMSNLQGFITGIQGITEDILIKAGYLSGAIIALTTTSLVTSITSLLGMSLVDLGTQLTGFITAALPFFTIIRTIDPSVIESARSLSEMLLILTAAELISGITSFLTGSSDFSTFGSQLYNFGTAIVGFSNLLRENGGIDEAAVTSAANAGKLLAQLQSSLEGSGGVKQWLFGEKNLGDFGTQLRTFGSAIVGFSNLLRENGGIDESAVMSAANAGKLLAELQSNLEASGGVKQWVFGEKNLGDFGTQLRTFGSAIVGFSNLLRENGGIDEASVTSAANAGKVMAVLQKEIESAGGLKQDLFGEKNLGTFGTQIKTFGSAIVDFSKIVSGNISDEAVTSAANAGRVMAEVQKAIPEDKWLDGKISIDDFGKKIAKFGEGLVSYSNEVINVDTGAVNSSLNAARSLVSITKSVVDLDASGIETFKKVKGIGSTLSGYSDKVSQISYSSITNSVVSVGTLITMIRKMSGLDTSGVSAFKAAISSLAGTDMSGFVNTFKDATKFASAGISIVNAIKTGITSQASSLTSVGAILINNLLNGILSRRSTIMTSITSMVSYMLLAITSKKEAFNSAGVLIVSKLSSGISNQSSKVKSAVSSVVSDAASAIRGYWSNFYNAGSYLVDGFVMGISANSFRASAQAAAMAKAAYNAAKEALDINSPSKVFRSLGYSVPEGFAMGIERLSNIVKGSSVEMANVAIDSVKKSISNISRVINSDIDSQPTIRPVLDLSDVKSGMGVIGGLFNNSKSIDVLANARSINNMMNNRNQNGVNSDLISAIDKLRNDMNNIGNTYYTVDGITYSNGTEVADAISALTRAIKAEGRI